MTKRPIKHFQSSYINCRLLISNSALGRYMEDSDYQGYQVAPGKICVEGSFWCSESGLNAELHLYIPPVNRNIDAWEGTRHAGESDLWAFLRIYCCPKNIELNTPIYDHVAIIAFKNSTFFDRPNEILQIIDLEHESPELNTLVNEMQTDLEWIDVNEIWEKFLELLNRKFDAVEI